MISHKYLSVQNVFKANHREKERLRERVCSQERASLQIIFGIPHSKHIQPPTLSTHTPTKTSYEHMCSPWLKRERERERAIRNVSRQNKKDIFYTFI